jgi:hypothetical protein
MKNCEKAENPSSPRVGAYVEREKSSQNDVAFFRFLSNQCVA